MTKTQLSAVLVPSDGSEGTCPAPPPVDGYSPHPSQAALSPMAFSPMSDFLSPESLVRKPDTGLGSASTNLASVEVDCISRNPCLSQVVVVMKHHDQKHVGQERVYFTLRHQKQ